MSLLKVSGNLGLYLRNRDRPVGTVDPDFFRLPNDANILSPLRSEKKIVGRITHFYACSVS